MGSRRPRLPRRRRLDETRGKNGILFTAYDWRRVAEEKLKSLDLKKDVAEHVKEFQTRATKALARVPHLENCTENKTVRLPTGAKDSKTTTTKAKSAASE